MSNGFVSIPVGARSNAEAVRAPKTSELIATHIRNAIIRGDLVDGDTLPAESHLIAEFGVSRPTIREAVRILEYEGLVTVARGARGGAHVRSPNYEMIERAAGITLQAKGVTIADLYEMRTLIEPPAARLVAERNSKAAVPLLREMVESEFALVDDRDTASARIAEFHHMVVELAGNKTMTMFSQAVRGLIEKHQALVHRRQPNLDPALSQRKLRFGFKSHERLVDLIEAEDGPGAEAHWREHMIAAGKIWLARTGPESVVDLLD